MSGSLCLILLFIAVLVKGGPPAQDCKTFVADLTKTLLALQSKCNKEVMAKAKNGKEKSKLIPCVYKCIFKKYGMIPESGEYHEPTFLKWKDDKVPKNLFPRIDWMWAQCDKYINVDPAQPYCESYEPITKCILTQQSQICIVPLKDEENEKEGVKGRARESVKEKNDNEKDKERKKKKEIKKDKEKEKGKE